MRCRQRQSPSLKRACLMANSRAAAYYLALTSRRMAFIPEVLAEDFYEMPIPPVTRNILQDVKDEKSLDKRVEGLFNLTAADQVLISDAIRYGIPELFRDETAPGRRSTVRGSNQLDPLATYCEHFLRVLCAATGRPSASATIFQEEGRATMPLRMMAIHLDDRGDNRIQLERIDNSKLATRLAQLNEILSVSVQGGLAIQRVATVFDTIVDADGRRIATAYFIKPDQMRYWTRSAALSDADNFFAAGFFTSNLWMACPQRRPSRLRRGTTIAELRWPDTPEFLVAASRIQGGCSLP